MFPRNRLKKFTVIACSTVLLSVLSSASLVAGNQKTIIRSDYDKGDYLLFMTTIGHNEDSKTGTSSRVIQPKAADELAGHDDRLSGYLGDGSVEVNVGKNTKLPNPKNYYALTGLEIEERKNNPCKIRLFGALVDPRYQGTVDRVVAEYQLERCKGLTTFADHRGFAYSEGTKNFDFTKDGKKFLRAVNVCGGHYSLGPQQAYTHRVWEVKGVRARASEVMLEDAVTLKPFVTELQRDEELKFTQPNCLNKVEEAPPNKPGWHSDWSKCPTGQIATGIRVYYVKKYFTGLKLNCQSVASRRIEKPPVKDAVGY